MTTAANDSAQVRPAQLVAENGAISHRNLMVASNGLERPVLLKGLCAAELEGDKWTLEGLLRLEPNTPVTAEYYADADRRKPYEHVTKSFAELALDIAAEPTRWFLAELDFDQVFPRVAEQLPPLSVLPADASYVLRLVFFGRDTQSATHFHVRDQAILAHLRGDKTVILAGPDTSKQLATNSPFGGRPQFSTHGPDAGADALTAFTDLVGDRAFEVKLDPGDALFIPVHWWHWAEGRGECLSVTTFWRASLRDWAWHHLGLRAATAVTLGETAKVVRATFARLKLR